MENKKGVENFTGEEFGGDDADVEEHYCYMKKESGDAIAYQVEVSDLFNVIHNHHSPRERKIIRLLLI